MLPALVQGGGEEGAFQEREQLLQEEACPANAELAALVGPSFSMLCDVKAAGGNSYYRLSDAKVGGTVAGTGKGIDWRCTLATGTAVGSLNGLNPEVHLAVRCTIPGEAPRTMVRIKH